MQEKNCVYGYAQYMEKINCKENEKMEKTLKIEGMMCGHCAARVKQRLEALPEVERADVSHEAGTATLWLKAEIADERLKSAVEDLGYGVIA